MSFPSRHLFSEKECWSSRAMLPTSCWSNLAQSPATTTQPNYFSVESYQWPWKVTNTRENQPNHWQPSVLFAHAAILSSSTIRRHVAIIPNRHPNIMIPWRQQKRLHQVLCHAACQQPPLCNLVTVQRSTCPERSFAMLHDPESPTDNMVEMGLAKIPLLRKSLGRALPF
jgi:hypothetical protein